MGDKYADNVNMLDVMRKLQEAPTLRDVETLVKDTYPTWIVGYYHQYSGDYPSLTKNWHTICTAAGCTPAQILVVDDMSFSDDHTIIRRFADIFTNAGFAVRRKADLLPCEKCSCMIPVRALYNLLKQKGETVPETWSPLCIGCMLDEDAPIVD